METISNQAHNLERLLQADGYKTWGFLVYGCTYASDLYWQKYLDLFLDEAKYNLGFYSGLDLLDNFAPTVFEDLSPY
ncbi:muramidase [Penicillium bovifimosum]|uniref:Muramidase n=1 Tax=Penicillium bovifimosum TaxID=126998 RepID=A0A9W9H271_9EURO|nr:muramidase [Penicillium bovifimosum]KAJ5135428.1 muramidase [Penicillium bovifimosum]